MGRGITSRSSCSARLGNRKYATLACDLGLRGDEPEFADLAAIAPQPGFVRRAGARLLSALSLHRGVYRSSRNWIRWVWSRTWCRSTSMPIRGSSQPWESLFDEPRLKLVALNCRWPIGRVVASYGEEDVLKRFFDGELASWRSWPPLPSPPRRSGPRYSRR